MSEMIHRNGRLAANIRAGRSPLTPEMIETIRHDANAGLDIPGPRVLQLLAKIERLRAIEQRAIEAVRRLRDDTPVARGYFLAADYIIGDAAPAASCIQTASCEDGDHTYSWPCDYAPGTGLLADVRVRAAELEHRRETAPDETTARQAADELHTLMDDVVNVAELPRKDHR